MKTISRNKCQMLKEDLGGAVLYFYFYFSPILQCSASGNSP